MFNGHALMRDVPRVRRTPNLDGVLTPDEPADLTFVQAVERRAAEIRGQTSDTQGWTARRMFVWCAILFGSGLLVLGVVAFLIAYAS